VKAAALRRHLDARRRRIARWCGRSRRSGLDLFVANAGIWKPEEVGDRDMSEEQWSTTMRRTSTRCLHDARRRTRHHRRRPNRSRVEHGGAAWRVVPLDYGASKGAIISFHEIAAVELARRDVTVTRSHRDGWRPR